MGKLSSSFQSELSCFIIGSVSFVEWTSDARILRTDSTVGNGTVAKVRDVGCFHVLIKAIIDISS